MNKDYAYVGVERKNVITDEWEPVAIVGIPKNDDSGLDALREVVNSRRRIVELGPMDYWADVLKDQRILEIKAFRTAVKILS